MADGCNELRVLDLGTILHQVDQGLEQNRTQAGGATGPGLRQVGETSRRLISPTMPFARRYALTGTALALVVMLTGCQRELIPTPNLYLDPELAPFAAVPPQLATNTVDLLYVTDRLPREGGDEDSVSYGYGRSFSTAFGSNPSIPSRIGCDTIVCDQH